MSLPSAGFLLDTQACVLWSAGDLPARVLRQLQKKPVIFYSLLSPWEVLIKSTYIRAGFTYQKFWTFVERIDAIPLDLKQTHLDRFADLPFFKEHTCLFDRMLIAQALTENLTIVGGDQYFPAYKGLRVLWD